MLVHIVSCYTGIMKFSGNETKAPRFSCFIALEHLRKGTLGNKGAFSWKIKRADITRLFYGRRILYDE